MTLNVDNSSAISEEVGRDENIEEFFYAIDVDDVEMSDLTLFRTLQDHTRYLR